MTRAPSAVFGVVLILAVGGFTYWQYRDVPESVVGDRVTDEMSQERGLTAAAVAIHNNAESCWSIINGAVYDLTSWIPKHPGGPDAILALCGVDGSERFNRQHGGDSAKEALLAGFRLGTRE